VVPVYTYYDTTSTRGKTKVFSVPCWAVESGDIFHDIPYIEKRRVVNGAYDVRKLLGSNADEVQYNLNEMIVNNVKETIEITSASLNNKYSLAHRDDIKPSAAPAVPLASDPKSVASLDKVYEESDGPMEALLKSADSSKTKAAKNVSERKKAADVFASTAGATTNAMPESKPETYNAKVEEVKPVAGDTVYRIQFYALKMYTPMDTNYYPHLKGYEAVQEGGMYKYYLGKYKTYEACYDFWHEQIQPRYKQSFIVKFVDGKRALK